MNAAAKPVSARQLRERWTSRGDVRPVGLPLRAVLDPVAQDPDLRRAQLVPRVHRWHAIVLVLGGDAVCELALVQVAGDDGVIAAQIREGSLASVEAKAGFAQLLVLPVTLEAGLREDGTHVAAEVDVFQGRIVLERSRRERR